MQMGDVVDLTDSPCPSPSASTHGKRVRAVCEVIDLDAVGSAEKRLRTCREKIALIVPSASPAAVEDALNRCSKTMDVDAVVEAVCSELLFADSSALTDEQFAARLVKEDEECVASSDRELARSLAAQDAAAPAAVHPHGSQSTPYWDETTGKTEGIMQALLSCLVQECKCKHDYDAYVCTNITAFGSVHGIDAGWGCGYRNTQTLVSHLLAREDGCKAHPYRQRLHGIVPSIASVQSLIEQAWSKGCVRVCTVNLCLLFPF